MAPPARCELVPDVGLVGDRGAQPGLQVVQPPELTRFDDLPHAVGQRMVAVVEGLEDDQAPVGGGGRGLGHGDGLGRVGGEGLLAQDVLSGGQRSQRPRRVEAVRERDVDGVDVGVADDRLVGVGDPGDPVPGGEGDGPGPIAGRHHLDDHLRVRGRRSDEGGRGDPRRAQDAESHCSRGHVGQLSGASWRMPSSATSLLGTAGRLSSGWPGPVDPDAPQGARPMGMRSSVPHWLSTLSWTWLPVASTIRLPPT